MNTHQHGYPTQRPVRRIVPWQAFAPPQSHYLPLVLAHPHDAPYILLGTAIEGGHTVEVVVVTGHE